MNGGRCIRRAGPKHDPDRGLCATDFAYHSRDAPEPRPTSIGVPRFGDRYTSQGAAANTRFRREGDEC